MSWLEPGRVGFQYLNIATTTAHSGHLVPPQPHLPVSLELPPPQRNLPWLQLLRSVPGTGARGGDRGGGGSWKLAQPRYTGLAEQPTFKKVLINYTEHSKILNNSAGSGVGEVFLSADYSNEAEGTFKGSLLSAEKQARMAAIL